MVPPRGPLVNSFRLGVRTTTLGAEQPEQMQSSNSTVRGRALARAGRLDEALDAFLEAVGLDGGALDAHLGIYEVAQILRRPELALAHQAAAIALAPVQSTPGERARRLRAAGAVRAGSVHRQHPGRPALRLALRHPAPLVRRPRRAGPAAPRARRGLRRDRRIRRGAPHLAAVERFVAGSRRPVLNRPGPIARLGRVPLSETFAAADHCRVVTTTRIERERYAAEGFPLPHIVRPVGSHGGHGLTLVESDADRAAYLTTVAAESLYVAPFIDYRSPDGFFRKYRIVFIDGEPFAFHLAISPHWMVHYYNAPMTEHQWMRDEEHAFLAGIGDVFAGELGAALRETARLLPLDYVGIDCAIGPDGKLLIFEADNALIIHLLDDPALFGYKHRYVPQILTALDTMVRRRIAAASGAAAR